MDFPDPIAMSTVHSARYKEFLKRLRAARVDANLTQIDVARALRKPQSYVSKCESGERRVDVVELERFAGVYNKPLSYFLPKRRSGG